MNYKLVRGNAFVTWTNNMKGTDVNRVEVIEKMLPEIGIKLGSDGEQRVI